MKLGKKPQRRPEGAQKGASKGAQGAREGKIGKGEGRRKKWGPKKGSTSFLFFPFLSFVLILLLLLFFLQLCHFLRTFKPVRGPLAGP
jgi:hypothetical protein